MIFRRRLNRTCGWIWLLTLFALPWKVQAQLPQARTINKIIVTNIGPQAVSESLVRANLRVKEGDPFVPTALNDDVPNLYATGYFSDIRVADEQTPDGVNLYYFLKAKPKVTDITFAGNRKYSTRKLSKKLTSKIGEPLDERKLFLDSQEIKKMYQKSGYPQTQVRYVPHPNEETGLATVTFEITESPKIKIADVYFEGAYAFTQRKLRKQLKTRRHWMFSWLTGTGVLKDEQLEEDRERLAEFYRDAGYIDFELKDVRYLYSTPRKVVVDFVISEGARYRVGAIDFKGVTLFNTNDLIKRLKMPVGSIFTPKGLYKDVEAIQDAYGARGYIGEGASDRVAVIARRNANTQTGTMDLVYEIEEGPKSYIEKIEIKGNTKTKDRVIRRELAVAPGEPFDMVRVKLSKRRLEGLRYFDRVEAQPEPTEIAPEQKNLVVTVNEMNTGNFSVGAGYSSLDSILGFVEVTQGNFDLFNPPWFMGGGQKLRLRAQFGARRQDYELTFVEPWLFGRKLEFSVDLYHRDLRFVSLNDLYDIRRTGARFGLSQPLFGNEFFRAGVSYTIENVDIHNVASNAPTVIQQEAGSRLVSKVGASLAYDTRSGTLLPTNGQRTEIRAEVAGGPFGGESDFYKIELGTAWYFRGFAEGHLLELGARGGVVKQYDDTARVPLFDRWFLGGIDSLRGYRYRQVGPRDPSGEPLGGNTYWFGSAEYSVPIVEFLRFAVFYDIGMVYEDAYQLNFGRYNDNYGLGIRLNIPRIGPLRLDYGIPIKSDPQNESNGRFQFSVGYTREF
jgi:outer membrane protein insertion porin family